MGLYGFSPPRLGVRPHSTSTLPVTTQSLQHRFCAKLSAGSQTKFDGQKLATRGTWLVAKKHSSERSFWIRCAVLYNAMHLPAVMGRPVTAQANVSAIGLSASSLLHAISTMSVSPRRFHLHISNAATVRDSCSSGCVTPDSWLQICTKVPRRSPVHPSPLTFLEPSRRNATPSAECCDCLCH